MKKTLKLAIISILATGVAAFSAKADDLSSSQNPAMAQDTRYGLFNWLDHRSEYGQGVFPEPFLVDDSDLELNEFRLDWLHSKAGPSRTDIGTAELEKGFGQVCSA